MTFWHNAFTGVSTYIPPARDPPETPTARRAMRRSSSFMKTEAQKKLQCALEKGSNESSDVGRVADEPPTSPTQAGRVSAGWNIKSVGCKHAPHRRALAMAAEPGLSMAMTYATSAAVKTLADGKIVPPSEHAAIVQEVKKAATAATYLPPHPLCDGDLPPHPLSDGFEETPPYFIGDDDDSSYADAAAQMPPATPGKRHHHSTPIWQEVAQSLPAPAAAMVPATALPVGGNGVLVPAAAPAAASCSTLARAPARKSSAPPQSSSVPLQHQFLQPQFHQFQQEQLRQQQQQQKQKQRPSSAPAASSRRPRRGSGVVLGKQHIAAAKQSVLPQIPEGAEDLPAAPSAASSAADPSAADESTSGAALMHHSTSSQRIQAWHQQHMLPASQYHIPVVASAPAPSASAPSALAPSSAPFDLSIDPAASTAAPARDATTSVPMTVGGGRHRISTGGDDEPRAAAARAAAARAAASRAALSSPVLGITAVTRDTTIYQQQQLQQLQDEQIAKALKATPGVALALQRQQAYHAAATTYHDAAASAPADEELVVVLPEPTYGQPQQQHHQQSAATASTSDNVRLSAAGLSARPQRPRSADARKSQEARAALVHQIAQQQASQQQAAQQCIAALHQAAQQQQQPQVPQPQPDASRVQMELEETKRALDAAKEREQYSSSQAQRLLEHNDVLLALLGQPNSGRAARAAKVLQYGYRALRESRAAVVPLQAAARRMLCGRRYARMKRAALCVQTARRGQRARTGYCSRRAAVTTIAGTRRAIVLRRSFLQSCAAARRVQRSVRSFLAVLRARPGRGMMWLETARLREELAALKHTLEHQPPSHKDMPPPCSPPHTAVSAPQPIALTPPTPNELPSKTADAPPPPPSHRPESPSLAAQLQEGFNHAMSAVTVFEVPDFLSNEELVVESHIFTDQLGFAWRLWVKPHDKQDSIGLYLVPAEDLDEPHTADFELAIVGARGRLWRRELRGGRATLHKRSAGHGWPTFVSRDELTRGDGDDRCAMLHEGTLVVTASRISNVRPKSEIEARALLSRTI